MAIGDILKDIGEGAAKAGRVAGAVLEPVGERVAQVASGEAPQIDEEQRQRQYQLEDAQINAKAQALESQLAMGQKYGTLNPQQQQQYIDQITGLYSHPRHAGVLMEKLRKAIHPNGAYAQAPATPLPNATPAGGTVAQDEAARERALADTLGLRQSATDEEIDRRAQDVAHYHKPAGKSPITPGSQIPPDALGPDGQLIASTLRTPGQSFVEWNGAWYPVAKPKPVFKTVKGHSVLVDSQSGAILRDLGPTGSAKITTRQTLQPGDDGQMHLVNLTSVTTPDGAQIEVEPETGETPEGGGGNPSAPATSETKPKRVGALLSRPTGARPTAGPKGAGAGPVVPGLSTLANSKNPRYKGALAQYTKNEPVLEAAESSIDSYIKDGVFDGPGDLALQHEFFTATQPATGFRMTKVQQDILQNSQNWLNSWQAKAHHATSGTWFSDEQRQQIAKTALEAIAAKKKAFQDSLASATPGAAPAETPTGNQQKVLVYNPTTGKLE